MAYVICEPCIGVKDASCTRVCPVGAIHPTPGTPQYEQQPQLYINPDLCIDCGQCASACPVEAIHPDVNVPPQWEHFIEINAAYFA